MGPAEPPLYRLVTRRVISRGFLAEPQLYKLAVRMRRRGASAIWFQPKYAAALWPFMCDFDA
jgi:hypothetical protein